MREQRAECTGVMGTAETALMAERAESQGIIETVLNTRESTVLPGIMETAYHPERHIGI